MGDNTKKWVCNGLEMSVEAKNGCKNLEMSGGSRRQLSVGIGSRQWVLSVEKCFRVRGTVLVEQALWDKWPASLCQRCITATNKGQ